MPSSPLRAAVPDAATLRQTLRDPAQHAAPDRAATVAAASRHPDASVRAVVAGVPDLLALPDCAALLARLAADPDARVRRAAAGRRDTHWLPEGAALVTTYLRDTDPQVAHAVPASVVAALVDRPSGRVPRAGATPIAAPRAGRPTAAVR